MADNDADQLRLDEATRFVLSSEPGRLFVWWVLEQCHLFGISMTGNSHTFYSEGERNIGLKIVAQIESTSPTAFAKLLMDAKADDAARQAREDDAAEDAE